MVEAMPFLPGLSPAAGRSLTACQDGGNLTSNGGLIVLREVARRLDIANVMVARCRMSATRCSSRTPMPRWSQRG